MRGIGILANQEEMIAMPRIIHFNLINPYKNNKFNKKALLDVRASVANNSYAALLLVQPLSSKKYLRTPERLSRNKLLQEQIDYVHYADYIAKLTNHITHNPNLPVFALYQKEDLSPTKTWITTLNSDNVIIPVPSEAGDAVPTIPHAFNLIPSWRILAGQVLSLGISELFIAGELAYEIGENEKKEQIGAVYRAYDSLYEYFSPGNFTSSEFKLAIISSLTYPNISVPKNYIR